MRANCILPDDPFAGHSGAKDRERLTKLLCLLGSEFDGERANAGAAADRQLRAMGLDWTELVRRAFRVPALPALRQPPPRPTFNSTAQIGWLLSCRRFLTPWELAFAQSLAEQSWPLSARQRAKLVEVAQRVEARADGGAG